MNTHTPACGAARARAGVGVRCGSPGTWRALGGRGSGAGSSPPRRWPTSASPPATNRRSDKRIYPWRGPIGGGTRGYTR
eukprot:551015-Prorocentrum_minimum.AAC.1